MAVLEIYDIEKNKVADAELDDRIFNAPVNENILYEVVTMQMAGRRQGTASTKGRSEVSGGGKKPWRQKGTGRARAGTNRSPIWRGGGIVFGPRPRNYAYTVPKKVRKAALRAALSMKMKENQIIILNDFPMPEIKTKKFKEVMDRFELHRVLFVLDKENDALGKSSRNLQGVKMLRAEGINVYDLMKYDTVVLLEPSIKKIEGALI
ncbi:MAG: 50S ribosomal protein L4 [Syntrophales bacterium]|jgi:large subunit ribosomal protein L4|nr:50S ribosomal protein L4 [Syntrophales bacterium]MDY0044721.1 50S ribosomal protein L4 [Syntrophales bacterium]